LRWGKLVFEEMKEEFDKILRYFTLENPICCLCVLSDGRNLKGFNINAEALDKIDLVDMIDYLIRNLEIKLEDIKKTESMRDRTDLMFEFIKRLDEK